MNIRPARDFWKNTEDIWKEGSEKAKKMIIWLASWPRCGNTLLRIILQQCFGVKAYSKYPGERLEWLFDDLPGYLDDLRKSDETYFIKTHEPPEDDSDSIHIIRDGRDACVSLSHFWNIELKSVISLDCIHSVDGLSIPGWSGYSRLWLKRGNKLVVSFEDMILRPEVVIANLEYRLGKRAIKEFDNNFDDLHDRLPVMFRKGKIGTWRDEFTAELEELFWNRHGDMMEALHYERKKIDETT